MRWIVGLDTQNRCVGAVRFASWLRERASASTDDHFIGVHVLDRDLVHQVLSRGDDDETGLRERAQAAVRESVAEAKVPDPLTEIVTVESTSPEHGLLEQVEAREATGLIIGRRGGRDEGALLRLGRTARRVLRRLPVPVMTVPPDLEMSELGSGPIMVAVDVHDRSVHAAEMAARLAAYLDRPLRIVHVLVLPETLNYYRGDRELRQSMVDDLRRDATHGLESWCSQHGLTQFAREVAVGDASSTIHERQAALESPFVVCGSRRLPLAERLFVSSMGTYLAATLPVPLLLVPPSPS